ncbi:3-oxoadipyl-CoA thiolase [Mongoliitalea lutea]|uniref:Beta-ketoadipyl-CoA thiolase n=1 Tax=Mongoliitalea lutea TaxID=849756 RepID=A0A8J3CVH3_9BACT|nr:3-oxoadipyl-CoA thiolase [Mongoliitalea lutea]GHB34529.1 acetyl-CoA acetyltransferase [Mongoliitalea lutea]
MQEVFICAFKRSPIGRYGGSLSGVRPDDLAAAVIKGTLATLPHVDTEAIDDVIFGCANQAGEDNRSVARMASLLAGLPTSIPGGTVNRLCGSGMDAILIASRMIKSGDADLILAGGVESMSRAPFIIPKADAAFSRNMSIEDSTLGYRFINPVLDSLYGSDSMPETAENVAEMYHIKREDQDRFAFASQEKCAAAQQSGRFAQEILPMEVKVVKNKVLFDQDEHPRAGTSLEKLGSLPVLFRKNGTVTAGNASGINDGAACLVLASEKAIKKYQLEPIARVLTGAVAGVPPRIMGIGPVPATQKLWVRTGLSDRDFDLYEFNEAFAAQALACLQELGIAFDDPRVNVNGGAIALGHPLGMSGARITGTLALEMQARKAKRGLATMCIGVGQGISIALELV